MKEVLSDFNLLEGRLQYYRERIRNGDGFNPRWLKGADRLTIDTLEEPGIRHHEPYLLRVVYRPKGLFLRALQIEGATGIVYKREEFTDYQVLEGPSLTMNVENPYTGSYGTFFTPGSKVLLRSFGDIGSTVRILGKETIVPGQSYEYEIRHVNPDTGKFNGSYSWGDSGEVKQVWLNGNPLVESPSRIK